MKPLENWKRMIGTAIGLSSLLLCFVLPGGFGSGFASAQGPEGPGGGWTPGKSLAGEITVSGTIREMVSGQGGVHLLVNSPLGSFDADLGPNLTGELRQALTTGAAVQLTGMLRSVNGKDVLFVRQMTVAGHQVTLRNTNGFLGRGPAASGSGTPKLHNAGNGGVQ